MDIHLTRVCEGYDSAAECSTSHLSYQFSDSAEAEAAIRQLGDPTTTLPKAFADRYITLYRPKTGGFVYISVDWEKGDPPAIKGWRRTKRPKCWQCRTKALAETDEDLTNLKTAYDSVLRHVLYETSGHARSYWAYKSEAGWTQHDSSYDPRLAIMATHKMSRSEADLIFGNAMRLPWTETAIPFAPLENVETREWNLKGCQLSYEPIEGDYKHWRLIFDHAFASLTPYLEKLEWARKYGIKTGGDYGIYWAASMLQQPFVPTPYLFLWSKQENTGKSTVHESLATLMSESGYVSADRALTSDFNGELRGAILCYVQEKNLRSKGTRERIKEWVNSPTIPLHAKRRDVIQIPNKLHFVQCSNDEGACPIVLGDTRVTSIRVSPLTCEIPRDELFKRLNAEGPAFTHHLLTLKLHPPVERLALPVVETAEKERAAEKNVDDKVVEIVDAMDAKLGDNDLWRGPCDDIIANTRALRRVIDDETLYFARRKIKATINPTRQNYGYQLILERTA